MQRAAGKLFLRDRLAVGKPIAPGSWMISGVSAPPSSAKRQTPAPGRHRMVKNQQPVAYRGIGSHTSPGSDGVIDPVDPLDQVRFPGSCLLPISRARLAEKGFRLDEVDPAPGAIHDRPVGRRQRCRRPPEDPDEKASFSDRLVGSVQPGASSRSKMRSGRPCLAAAAHRYKGQWP